MWSETKIFTCPRNLDETEIDTLQKRDRDLFRDTAFDMLAIQVAYLCHDPLQAFCYLCIAHEYYNSKK